MKINDKAKYFEMLITDYFITPENCMTSHYRFSDKLHNGFSDQPFFTGIAATAFSLKYASTKNKADKKLATRFIKGLFKLQDVTQTKGLLARGIRDHKSPEYMEVGGSPLIEKSNMTSGTVTFKYHWLRDVSTDQLIGTICGYSAAYKLIDDGDLKNEIRKRVCDIADHLIDNNMQIIDVTGKRTKHGELRKYISFLPKDWFRIFPNTLNCLIALAVFGLAIKVTYDVTGGEYRDYNNNHIIYKNYYNKLIKKGYDNFAIKARSAFWEYPAYYLGMRNVSDDNLAFLSYLSLYFTNPDADYLIKSVKQTWKYVEKGANPFFDFVYKYIIFNNLIFENRKEWFEDYSEERRIKKIDLKDLEQYPIYLYKHFKITAHGKKVQSWIPVNIKHQPTMGFSFAGNPFIREEGKENLDSTTSGLDYILAYWVGKYYASL